MPRFIGNVGFSKSELTSPGVYEDTIELRRYKGDVIRNNATINTDDDLGGDISISHSVSIIGDEYAWFHPNAIRFVEWAGGFWVVRTVQLSRPRLILGLGGVYNGPKD